MKQRIVIPVIIMMLMTPMWAQAEDGWNFKLSPYVWFAGVKGTVSTIPGAPAVPINVSSSDALSDTKASLMLLFEAKKQRHGVLIDLLYTDVQSTEDLIPAIGLTMKSISKTTILSTAYMYELYKKEQAIVDLFAGARYWKVDTELQFGGGLGVLNGRNIRNAESWADPLIGIKARAPLGNSRFYAAGGVAAGGFGAGSDSFYDINANVGYQWSEAIGTSLGYRLFDVKYENGSFLYDVKQEGWLLALTWAF
jgi:hypothetical protein